ncbi:hypothetical protein CONLIGDRAFT_646417 [Coniochaeta ligniaria NRRL 30616]|uniref:Ecp2 effector protein-like domain-containing protein n=1 Tax=Coniochaeta ligniaria NRRL 30616 TaxID=1408157 RepID=A0A1J7J8W2_9PEZI|nr:hypothetical protein CONLIGDRAFT_646417 [Coniochaeta ligniaria NRRL 30616]
MALPSKYASVENMVPRKFTAPDGPLATVYVNRNLDFAPVPRGTATTRLSRRVLFTTGSADDYCSETDPTETFGADAPLAADCDAIRKHMETIDGYYTVSPSDFNPSTGWATIASSGTCSFAIKFQLSADTKKVVIGTNDVHFYLQGYLRDAQNGRIQAVGTISCNNNLELLFLYWGMIHS